MAKPDKIIALSNDSVFKKTNYRDNLLLPEVKVNDQ